MYTNSTEVYLYIDCSPSERMLTEEKILVLLHATAFPPTLWRYKDLNAEYSPHQWTRMALCPDEDGVSFIGV